MKHVKYVYNAHTLKYEEHKLTRKEKVKKSFAFISTVILTSVILFVLAYQYFPTPKERLLEKESEANEFYLTQLQDEYELLSNK
ncbi:MAG TPA: hypothetical protein PK611_05810, partial [Saprospiraceae bacterium]|nr:hypothetical protein [Saprospiraceae bacterium]